MGNRHPACSTLNGDVLQKNPVSGPSFWPKKRHQMAQNLTIMREILSFVTIFPIWRKKTNALPER
jgi:hypothetical protein